MLFGINLIGIFQHQLTLFFQHIFYFKRLNIKTSFLNSPAAMLKLTNFIKINFEINNIKNHKKIMATR